MTRHPGLRAGILGAAASIILSLLALIPFFGCLIMPISLLLYVGIGMLAAYLQLRRRPQTSKQRIAQLGFLAGLVTGLADGVVGLATVCLLYTSDAADERSSVDLGGRRIIKKKN